MMADFKQRAVQHLAYARRWLEQAEHAFGQKRDVRGELDLLLAQAEIEHAKEMSQRRRPRFWLVALRHAVALLLAVTMVGAGTWGALLWLHQPVPAAPAPTDAANSHAVLPAPAPAPDHVTGMAAGSPPTVAAPVPAAVSAAISSPAAPVPAKTSEPAYQPATAAHHDSAASAAAVSPQEMRQLLRTADKALRGQ